MRNERALPPNEMQSTGGAKMLPGVTRLPCTQNMSFCYAAIRTWQSSVTRGEIDTDHDPKCKKLHRGRASSARKRTALDRTARVTVRNVLVASWQFRSRLHTTATRVRNETRC